MTSGSLVNNNSLKQLRFDPIQAMCHIILDVKFIHTQGGCGGIRQDSESLAKLFAGYE